MTAQELLEKLVDITNEEGVGLRVMFYDDADDELYTVESVEVNTDSGLPEILLIGEEYHGDA
jgi:hypothetical protein